MKEVVPHCRNNCAFSLSQLTRVSDNLLAGLQSRIHPLYAVIISRRTIHQTCFFCKDTPKYRSATQSGMIATHPHERRPNDDFKITTLLYGNKRASLILKHSI